MTIRFRNMEIISDQDKNSFREGWGYVHERKGSQELDTTLPTVLQFEK